MTSSQHQSVDPPKPDVDENGVDRAQIRAMLALTPEERLKKVEEFVEGALEIRELNEARLSQRDLANPDYNASAKYSATSAD